MEGLNLNLIIIVGYFLALVIIGFIASRKETTEDYFIGSRKISGIKLAASLCAGFWGGGFIVMASGFGYLYGWNAMWVVLGQSIGLLMFTLIATKIKKISDKKKFYTLPDYFYHKFDKKTGLLASCMVFFYITGFIIIQLIVGGKIISQIGGWDYNISVIITCTIVFMYLYLGGFRAIIRTDLFQYFFLLFMVILLFFSLNNNFEKVTTPSLEIELPKVLSFLLLGIFFVFIGSDVWQRAYAAKSPKELKKGLVMGSFFHLIIGVIVVSLGIVVSNFFAGLIPEDVLVVGFTNLLPQSFHVIGLVIIFSAIMSTCDTLIFVAALSLSNDIASKFFKIDDITKEVITKISIIFITIICLYFAIKVQQIIDLAILFTSVMLTFIPSIFMSFMKKKIAGRVVFYSISISLISYIFILVNKGIQEELAIFSLLISSCLFFIFYQINKFLPKKITKNGKQ